jgi:hypothetical protein
MIFKKIKNCVINPLPDNGSITPIPAATDNPKKSEEILLKRGLFNGDILCSTSFKIENEILSVDCGSFKFFDMLLNHFEGKKFPKMFNVNALLEVDDNLVLIKRDNRVFSYPGYWDFPAGLVPFGINPLERMSNRITEDTKLPKEDFETEPEPFLLGFSKKSFALYYRAKCKKTSAELLDFFQQNFKKTRPILLKKAEIQSFLQNNRVFPVKVLKSL